MSYLPSHEPRIKAAEDAVRSLTKAVILAHDMLNDIAEATSDPGLKARLAAGTTEMAILLQTAVAEITGQKSPIE